MSKSTENVMMGYLLKELVLILAISYLVFFASTHNGIVNPITLAISAGFFSILLVIWLLRKSYSSIRWVESAVLIFLGVTFITCLTSIDPRRSLVEFWLLGVSFFLFFITAELVRSGWPAELIVKCLLVVGSLVMLFAWIEFGLWYSQWLNASSGKFLPDVTYRLAVPNFMGVVINILLMMSLARLFSARDLVGRIVLSVFVISGIALIFLSSSRGGWIGTGGGLLVLGIFLNQKHRDKVIYLQRMVLQKRLFLGIALLIGAAVLVGGGLLLYKQTLHPTHSSILSARKGFWGPAWNGFIASPWFGQGPYTFISLLSQTISIPPFGLFVYSHSIYLDVLSGSGILGFLAFMWMAVVFIRELIRRCRATFEDQSNVLMGASAALIAFLLHGLFDSVHHTIPTSAWVLSLVLGAAFGVFDGGERKLAASRRGAWWLGVVVVIFSWFNLWLLVPYYSGVSAANRGDWEEAVRHFSIAAVRDRYLSVAHQQLGLAESVLATQGDSRALQSSVAAFQSAISIDPYWVVNYMNLGALLKSSGDLPGAENAFGKAVNHAPRCDYCYLNLGEAREMLGDWGGAEFAYTKALQLNPDWANSYYFRSTQFRQGLVIGFKKMYPESNPTVQDLRTFIEKNPSVALPYIKLAMIYLNERKLEEVGPLLSKAELAYFSRGEEKLELRWAQAEFLAAQGEYIKSVELGEAAIDGFRQQGSYGPGTYGEGMYVPLMYRRPAMSMELVPQLTLIRFTDLWGKRIISLADWYKALGYENDYQRLMDEVERYIPDYKEYLDDTLN